MSTTAAPDREFRALKARWQGLDSAERRAIEERVRREFPELDALAPERLRRVALRDRALELLARRGPGA